MFRIFIFLLCVVLSTVFSSELLAQQPSGEKREKEVPAEVILVEKGGVLLPRGTLQIEPSLQYSYLSRHVISISGFYILEAILIGEIAVSDIKRDILQAALTARYGITSRLQAELKIPGIYRSDRDVRGPGTADVSEKTVSQFGLGDIEGALYYHLLLAKGWIPDIILNCRAKSITGKDPYHLSVDSEGRFRELPTGNGHWGLSGGFTAVKVSDPAVFFGSFNYFWNIRKNINETVGTVDPGDSYEASFGIAYALSEKVSLSTQYQHRWAVHTKVNGNKIDGSYLSAGTLFFGGNYILSKSVSVSLQVGIGVTNDAPDVQVTLLMPINFKIF
jgi:hypothetical protein